MRHVNFSDFHLHGKVEFEFRWELLFRIKSVREVYPPHTAVGMNLNPQGLDVIGPISSPREIGKI